MRLGPEIVRLLFDIVDLSRLLMKYAHDEKENRVFSQNI